MSNPAETNRGPINIPGNVDCWEEIRRRQKRLQNISEMCMSGELPLKEYDDMIRNTVLTPLDTPIDPEDNKQTTEPPNEPISNPNPETNGDSVQNFTT